MPLLKEIYPDARFLHIIRDPRDYCLSVYKSWGKSTQRAAHDWQATLQQVAQEKEALGMDYLEVRYETLVRYPEGVLKKICRFLECDFVPEMLYLNRETGNLGDTQGQLDVVGTNTQCCRNQYAEVSVRDDAFRRRVQKLFALKRSSIQLQRSWAIRWKLPRDQEHSHL